MISVVFLCSNQNETLANMTNVNLQRVRANFKDYELIIVDNAGIDSDNLKKYADTYIKNEINEGFAKGMNKGMKSAKGDYFVIMSNDVEVYDNVLEPLKELLDNDKKVGIAFPSFINKGHQKSEEIIEDDPDGSFYMLKKEVYDKIGGFDERFSPSYFEDADWFYRMKLAGYRFLRIGKVLVKHLENKTTSSLNIYESSFTENRKRFIQKWGWDSYGIHFKHFPL